MFFNFNHYVNQQTEKFKEVFQKFDRTVVEVGGKFLDDHHCKRVLKGCNADVKVSIFSNFINKCEVLICVNSENIQNDRIRSDYNTKYTEDCILKITEYRQLGFKVKGVVLTAYKGQEKAKDFLKLLHNLGENVYTFSYIEDYPNNIDNVLNSFKNNEIIQFERDIILVTSSGAASGKLSTSLNIIYQQYEQKVNVGYVKYDIFPIWNLSKDHVVNDAFIAATADIQDEIVVDNYYKEKYGVEVSSYRRDFDLFPLIRKILDKAMKDSSYNSPTEMTVNLVLNSIMDEEELCKSARQEIYRRYLTYIKQFLRGDSKYDSIEIVESIMKKHNITELDFPFVDEAEKRFKLNNVKELIAIEEYNHIISKYENMTLVASLIYDILDLKECEKEFLMYMEDTNIEIIAIKDILNFIAHNKKYLFKLDKIKGLNVHTSSLISKEDEEELIKLGLLITCSI